MPVQKILSGYRVTIPKDFRIRHNISVGDLVQVNELDSQIIIRLVEVKEKE